MTSTWEEMRSITTRSQIPVLLRTCGLTHWVVEVGVRFGYNLEQLLAARPDHVYAIDHWKDTGEPGEQDTLLSQEKLDSIHLDVVGRFLDRPNISIIRAGSHDAASLFPLYSLDFVYIDANHLKGPCLEDMVIWWERIRQGGILAGHDHVKERSRDGSSFGVIEAVKEFRQQKKIEDVHFHVTHRGWKTWLIYKEEGE